MTVVEELILENQLRIMLALAVMLPDKEMAASLYEGGSLSRAQTEEWKRAAGQREAARDA